MGLFDDATKGLGGLGGGQAAGGQGALVQALLGMLTGGGLQQLLGSFQQKGLGDVASSWVSRGDNKPISPDQLQQAIGPDQLGRLSQQTGLDQGTLSTQLSSLLPGLVDKLTPDGRVPEGGVKPEGLGGMLKGLF
jgi:uncharacterized protein YidB (DUF937 family)